jgi:hypothetical protein
MFGRIPVASFICLAVLLPVLATTHAGAEEWAATATNDEVRVYKKLDMESAVVRTLEKGERVIVQWSGDYHPVQWCSIREPDGIYTLGFVPCQDLDLEIRAEIRGQESETLTLTMGELKDRYEGFTVEIYMTDW